MSGLHAPGQACELCINEDIVPMQQADRLHRMHHSFVDVLHMQKFQG